MRFSRQVSWGSLPFFPPVNSISVTLSFFLSFFWVVLGPHCCMGFTLPAVSRGYSLVGCTRSHCSGFSRCGVWAPGRPGFGSCGSQALQHWLSSSAHGLSCSAAWQIFPDFILNPWLLHGQANSLPLSRQGSTELILL